MTGLLLVNVGTPEAPEPGAVRRYLREFLGDPRVIDISAVGRFLLLNLIILPRRPKRSAEAYQKIWTVNGSPLLVHGRALAAGVGEKLGPAWQVELAMRYGNPSLADALARFRDRGVDRIVVFPLYPQYSASSTGTSVEEIARLISREWVLPSLSFVPPFYDHPEFIKSFVSVGTPILDDFHPDHVLFSFHGLPERHMRKADATGRHCLSKPSCCETIVPANRNCYRAQCFATARLLREALQLDSEMTTVCFQSRLGRTPWVSPYTDVVLPDLARQGKKRVAVFTPAFVADCLETLEEIAIRGRDQFRAAGGEELVLVPSLNSHSAWVSAVATLAQNHASH